MGEGASARRVVPSHGRAGLGLTPSQESRLHEQPVLSSPPSLLRVRYRHLGFSRVFPHPLSRGYHEPD